MVEETKDAVETVEEEVQRTPEQIAENLYGDKKEKEDAPTQEDQQEETQEEAKEQEAETVDQAGEQEETEKETPVELELSLSKDSPLDEGYVEAVKEYAKENELTQEQAQDILSHKEDAVSDYVEDQRIKAEALADKGLAEIKSDPILGGDNFKASQELALRAINDTRLISEEDKPVFEKILVEQRLADDPVIFRFFHNIGKMSADDKYLRAENPVKQNKSIEERWYGEQAK